MAWKVYVQGKLYVLQQASKKVPNALLINYCKVFWVLQQGTAKGFRVLQQGTAKGFRVLQQGTGKGFRVL